MTVEHRRHPRFAVSVAAEVTLGSKIVSASTQNVSEGGVGLSLGALVEEGDALSLTLFLTQDGIEDPDEEPFEVRAFVAWSAPREDGGCVAGVRFGGLDAEQRDHLARFLAALEG